MDEETSNIVNFETAVRKNSRVLVFFYGESGSGKTYSALLLARGLVGPKGKVFGLDTESGRMLDYADEPELGGFIHGNLTPPFSPERYSAAINQAVEMGADALVIDSLSHEWSDLGGVLDLAEHEGRTKRGLQKWTQPKLRHKRFKSNLLRQRVHIIGCLRAKPKFKELVENGSKKLVKDGFLAEQDQAFKYEATVQVLFTNECPGLPVIEKLPKMLAGAFREGERVCVETGQRIASWTAGGAAVDPAFLALKARAESAAEEGTVALKAVWDGLTREERTALKPYMANLKSMAEEADQNAEPSGDEEAA